MNARELADRARLEAGILGDPPANRANRNLWMVRRRGAIEMLAALADYDTDLIRRALMQINPGLRPRNLLIEAVRVRRTDPDSEPAAQEQAEAATQELTYPSDETDEG